MKPRSLCFCCMLILLLLLSGCGKEATLTLIRGQTFSLTAEEVLTSGQDLVSIQPHETGYILYTLGASCTLDATLSPSPWVVDEFAPKATEIGRYTTPDSQYTIESNGDIRKNGELLSLTLPNDVLPRGFWKLGNSLYLFADRLDADGVAEASLLFPWEKDKPGDTLLPEGLPGNARLIATGDGYGYGLFEDVLYRTDGKTLDLLGSLFDCGINPLEVKSLLPTGGGSLFLVTSHQLWRLTLTEGSQDETSPLVIAAYRTPSMTLTRQVTDYNLHTKGIRVEIKQYDEKADLNLAILTGDVDLVASDNAGLMENYARKGYLMGLDEVLSAELSQGDLFENVVDAGRIDGTLYYLPAYFKAMGMALPRGLVEQYGEPETIPELISLLDKLGNDDFYKLQSRDYALNNFLIHGLDFWVNRANATCSFENSEDFIALLTLCHRYAATTDEVLVNQHSGLAGFAFHPSYAIHDVNSLDLSTLFVSDVTQTPLTAFGGEGILIPSPTSRQEGFSIFPDSLYGVVQTSEKSKEAADWLRWAISTETYEYQQDWLLEVPIALPLRMSATEALVNALLADANGEDRAEMVASYHAAWKSTLTRANTYSPGGVDEIAAIVSEEAAHYFAGDVTAEKAAELIQNRVSILLSEQE